MFKSLSCIWMEVSRVTCHVAGDELIVTQPPYNLVTRPRLASCTITPSVVVVRFEDVTISLCHIEDMMKPHLH